MAPRFCSNCGSPLQPTDAVCPKCGAQVLAPAYFPAGPPQVQAKQQGVPGWLLALIAVAAVGVIILGFAAVVTIAGLAVRNAGERSKQATMRAQLMVINDALELARYDAGKPKANYTVEQLASERPPPGVDASKWRGPYITEVPVHPYGGKYVVGTDGHYMSR